MLNKVVFIFSILIAVECLGVETVSQDNIQDDWRYYASIKAFEKWLNKDRQKIDINAQIGIQQEKLKYELDVKHSHPDYNGFNSDKNSFHETKQSRTALAVNLYYEVLSINNFSFNPFIGAGLHNSKIVKREIKLKPVQPEGNRYAKEYIYRKKTKRGLLYNVGAEGSYAMTENMYASLGWHMQEFVNARLSGKRYNEQKVYLKLGYCFK